MPAILQEISDTSKVSIALMPLSPLVSRDQTCSTPQPSGLTIPMPVTTTRLIQSLRPNWSFRTATAPRPLRHRADLCPRTSGNQARPGPPPEPLGTRPALGGLALGVLLKELNGVAHG